MYRRVVLLFFAATLLGCSSPVFADDGGGTGSNNESTVNDASAGDEDASPLACDGALCGTRNDTQCDVPEGSLGNVRFGSPGVVLAGAFAVLGLSRRRRVAGARCPPTGSRAR